MIGFAIAFAALVKVFGECREPTRGYVSAFEHRARDQCRRFARALDERFANLQRPTPLYFGAQSNFDDPVTAMRAMKHGEDLVEATTIAGWNIHDQRVRPRLCAFYDLVSAPLGKDLAPSGSELKHIGASIWENIRLKFPQYPRHVISRRPSRR